MKAHNIRDNDALQAYFNTRVLKIVARLHRHMIGWDEVLTRPACRSVWWCSRGAAKRERNIVIHGEPVRRQVTLRSSRTGRTVQLTVNYDNAVAAVERSLRSDNERSRRLVQRFLVTRVCSVCHGARLRPEALTSQLGGRNMAEVSALGLGELRAFTESLPAGLPAELSRVTTGLLAELDSTLTPLLDVGLGYLTLDRSGASLSTGERQRIELTSTVRLSTTGMLYVLDEPSVGLHPSNVVGLRKTIAALAANGNSVVIVEHERELIRTADWVIELGPGAGTKGGRVIAQGTPGQLQKDKAVSHGPVPGGRPGRAPDHRPERQRPTGKSLSKSMLCTICATSPPPFRYTA